MKNTVFGNTGLEEAGNIYKPQTKLPANFKCPHCSAMNPSIYDRCYNCKKPLHSGPESPGFTKCRKCKEKISKDVALCPYCGAMQ